MPCRPLSDAIQRYLVPWQQLDWPIDWEAAFGRPGRLVVEIGFGNGAFLVDQAVGDGPANCVGIETSWESVRRLFRRLDQAGIGNVRAVQGDGHFVLQHLFAPGTIDAVYINFSDPWWKQRHHGRRLIQSAFVSLLAERLVPGGRVTIATDHLTYAQWITEVLEAQRALRSCFATPLVAHLPGRMPTKYEQKASAAGAANSYFVWERRAGAGPPAQIQEVGAMPNVILAGTPDLNTLCAGVTPQTWQETHEGISVVMHARAVYRQQGAPQWIVEMFVKEDRLGQSFGIAVVARRDGTLAVKLASLGLPRPTWGVKRAVWHVAELLQQAEPSLRIISSTLGDAAREGRVPSAAAAV